MRSIAELNVPVKSRPPLRWPDCVKRPVGPGPKFGSAIYLLEEGEESLPLCTLSSWDARVIGDSLLLSCCQSFGEDVRQALRQIGGQWDRDLRSYRVRPSYTTWHALIAFLAHYRVRMYDRTYEWLRAQYERMEAGR